MAKLTDKSVNGTSFYDTTIKTTLSQLIKALGKPQCFQNDGSDKTNVDFECETKDGDVFTIYDWKEYRSISKDEQIKWHIGGDNVSITSTAAVELGFLLNVEEYPGE